MSESIDGRLERAKDAALGAHKGEPSLGDELGEATGGISGVLVGAGIGSAAGPVGTLIGGIAGALTGWWAGRAVSEAASTLSHEDEEYYRENYEKLPVRAADRAYDDVRGAYYLGHIASQNPNYRERLFTEVEPELEKGWATGPGEGLGSWTSVRDYAETGFNRGRSRLDDRAGRSREEGRVPSERDESRP